MKTFDVVFFVQYPYYLPHFLPIANELQTNDLSCILIFGEKNFNRKIANTLKMKYLVGEEHLHTLSYKVIFFANTYGRRDEISAKTIYISHGTGIKSTNFSKKVHYYDYLVAEGDYRYEQMTKHLKREEQQKILKYGFTKLDPVINMSDADKKVLFERFKLDPEKKTILYAPTYYPSSIGKMGKHFPKDLAEYNILVKPHFLSLSRSQYSQQQKRFAAWAKYDNCHIATLEDYDLTPFTIVISLEYCL